MLDLTAEQLFIEEGMASQALLRATKDDQESSNRGEWSSSKVGSKFVQAVMDQRSSDESLSFLASVAKFIDDVSTRKAGRHFIAAKLLANCDLKPEVICLITTKVILSNIGSRKGRVKRSSLCMHIASAVEHEWRIKYFAQSDARKSLLKKLFKDFDRRTYPKHWRIRTIKNYFDAEHIEWQVWENKEKLAIGYALLTLFKDSTGLLEYTGEGTFVEPSGKLTDHIGKMLKSGSSMYVLHQPMVVPPVPWSETNLFRGGYHSNKVRRYPLIKGSSKRDVERLGSLDLSKVFKAVNAMQETPWRINKQMLEAQHWAYHVYGGGIGSMEAAEEEPLPPLPEDYDTNEDVKKAHNRLVFEVHDRRRQAKSKRISVLVTLSLADRFSQYDAIYFPHNLDSRGRAYPLPAFLNPQGPDFTKALLEFSKGYPIYTQEAEDWLCIAGANAYGNDKVSLAERVQWVRDNSEMILSCGSDYKADRRWMQAAEPFQFLRFCFEWLSYTVNQSHHMSHMVIPVDATNSGLQHYSAMLRDEVGGRSVNLVPGLPRADIYGDVAHRVIEYLMEEGGPDAKALVSLGIDRKITKRQVMVVPYAGKFSSCLSYTKDAVKEKLLSGVMPAWDTNDNEKHNLLMIYLAKLIWKAIDETVVRGKVAMTWLSKIAAEYAKAMNASGVPVYDRKMTWLTPDGFEVVHFREDMDMHRVKTTFEGTVYLSYYRQNGKLNVKDMALACPPNFVHALDATHLRLTIIKALDHEITDFGMVHDSFGVHAAKMPEFLAKAVRPAFVEMYEEHDVIQEFADRFKDQSATLNTPEKGTLDLKGVLQSEFFFS